MTTDHELLGAVERCYENFAKAVDGESSMAYVITADLELVLDRLQSLLSCSWQDISTAPKDGSDILILSNGCCVCGYWNSREGAFVTFQYGIYSPTHGMPLPLKPTGEL